MKIMGFYLQNFVGKVGKVGKRGGKIGLVKRKCIMDCECELLYYGELKFYPYKPCNMYI